MGASREDRSSADSTRPDPKRREPKARLAPESFVVAGYRLIDLIGIGGMGQVWRAKHEKHGKVAAVKLILRDFSGDAGDGITHEFRFLAEMQHPHIVTVFDTGMCEMPDGCAYPYVVMTLVTGATPINEYAAAHTLDPRARVELFLQACRAVEYVHACGVVHLDIKPENILVDDTGHVVLTDFGLARPVLGWFLEKSAGTPPYMSPEHLDGDVDRINKPSDVWAMGAVLFRLIANEHAYDVKSRASRTERHRVVQSAPRTLASAAPHLKRDIPDLLKPLEAIVHKSLDPLPENRFADGRELRGAVEEALEAHPVVRTLTQSRHHHPKAWSTLGLAAIVLLSSVLGVLVTAPVVWLWRAPVDWLGTSLPAPRNSIAGLESLPNVAMVGYDTQTAIDLMKTESLSGIDPGHRPTFRRMHAGLIPRLVEAGARVITLDLCFPSESDPTTDAMLAAAIVNAREAGTPVVAGVNTWRLREGRPLMSAPIYEAGPAFAGLTISKDAGQHVADLLVTREGTEPIPGLSLATLAAYLSPDTYHEYRLEEESIVIRHFTAERADRRDVVGEIRIRPLQTTRHKGDPDVGLEPGDLVSISATSPATLAAMNRSTFDYADIWAMTPDERRKHLGRRAVVVFDRDEDLLDGTIPCHIHATAVQALVLGYGTRLATWLNVPLTALGAVIGLASGVVAARRRVRRLLRRTAGEPAHPTGGVTAAARGLPVVLGATIAGALVLLSIMGLADFLFAVWLYPYPGIAAAGIASALVLAWASSRFRIAAAS